MTNNMVDYSSRDSPYGSNEQCGVGNSSNLENTLRSLMKKIRSCKEDNDKVMHAQEKKAQINAIILQFFLELQRQGPLRISHG